MTLILASSTDLIDVKSISIKDHVGTVQERDSASGALDEPEERAFYWTVTRSASDAEASPEPNYVDCIATARAVDFPL